jgi:hypothetical protein
MKNSRFVPGGGIQREKGGLTDINDNPYQPFVFLWYYLASSDPLRIDTAVSSDCRDLLSPTAIGNSIGSLMIGSNNTDSSTLRHVKRVKRTSSSALLSPFLKKRSLESDNGMDIDGKY